MSGYIKIFENGGKSMSFEIKYDDLLDKYDEIWEKIKTNLNTKFHNMLVHDEKYIKAKIREFNGVIKTNFLGDTKIKCALRLHSLCNYWFCYGNENYYEDYPQVYLDEYKYKPKRIKMTKFLDTELESESELKLESDTEESKSELQSHSK